MVEEGNNVEEKVQCVVVESCVGKISVLAKMQIQASVAVNH